MLLATASLLAVLALVEAALRVRSAVAARTGFDAAMAASKAPRAGATVRLGEIIRPSADARIVYELWPGMDVVFDTGTGARSTVRTSAEGFRSREVPIEKAGHRLRVAGLGDSLMFGWGVDQGADYLSVLQRRLNESATGTTWEALNTAVPGYNAAMEVETLKTKVLKYRPDVVVYGFCPNDASLPNFILSSPDPLSWRESFLWGFVRGRLHPELETGDALVAAPRRGDDLAFEDDPARVPERYRAITGWDAYGRALEELRELGRAHGFRTIVLAFVPGSDDPRKERGLRRAADLGLPVVDVGETQAAWLRDHAVRTYAGSPLTVSATDLHPSPLSHELAADELRKKIAEFGLVAPSEDGAAPGP
jgi:hypothetical protein